MTTPTLDSRLDRLYKLLPAIYRIRDTEQQYALQALLRVIAEQVNVVQDNIAQLYDNWFIETAEDWAVPYIADLIGYKPAVDAGLASDGTTAEGRALNRTLIPRRDVANTIRYRRRKGTLAVLEGLAHDVGNWPAHAVEFFKFLGWNQNLNHLHMHRARTANLRDVEALDLLRGPFDPLAHTVNLRRIDSHRTIGRHNIPSVGVFLWRLNSYSVTQTPAYCAEESGPECYTFSVLGQDARLFIKPGPEPSLECEPETDNDSTWIAQELSVPASIRRFPFAHHTDRFYGADKSLAIWVDGWTNNDDQPVPLNDIVPADLSSWQYSPDPNKIAVDPVLGRLAFSPGHLPRKGVRVSYHYGFSADIGGGEYTRTIFDPSNPDFKLYQVGKDPAYFHKIGEALQQWQKDKPADAVIELMDSAVYVELISITLAEGQTLQIRAANGKRPVIRMLDWQTDLPDALSVTMAPKSCFTLDGLMITGRPVQISGPDRETPSSQPTPSAPAPNPNALTVNAPKANTPGATAPLTNNRPVPPDTAPICAAHVVIRHCTLVPGWGIDCDCQPKRPAEPSIELFNVRAAVHIERSITGAIQINEDEVAIDPIPVYICDSILDATDPQKEAIGAPGQAVAHALLSVQRTTVFGIVDVHAITSADDSIFMGCVNVTRRQLGCMRFCYVPPGCRTARRYHCQPDLVTQAVTDEVADLPARARLIASERVRVRPQFTSVRYGKSGYAQLGEYCAQEIKRGAEDESEMGVFHDLFQPQREANLKARLEEFTPAGMDVGILFAN